MTKIMHILIQIFKKINKKKRRGGNSCERSERYKFIPIPSLTTKGYKVSLAKVKFRKFLYKKHQSTDWFYVDIF